MPFMPTRVVKCSGISIHQPVCRSQAALAAWHRPLLQKRKCAISKISSQAAAIPDVEKVTEPGIVVRPAVLSELDDVAWLRAEAFYEASCCLWQHSATHHQIKLTLHQSAARETRTMLQKVMVSP